MVDTCRAAKWRGKYLPLFTGRFNLRSCKELLLERSRVKTKKTLGDKSFQVAAPGLWNKLPSEIRAIRSYDHFKRAIKTYLFKKAFACYS